ncbi:MAG: TetR-like C-terminal domain-containing protein [Stappiaceae bacterium]
MGDLGRPQAARVTDALLGAAIKALANQGYEHATIAAIAAEAKTSKQAVYRRWRDKPALMAAAVKEALGKANQSPPQRGSVALDLRICLQNTTRTLQETPLGEALRALVAVRHLPELGSVLNEAEDDRRLIMRQIFIATPFEAGMEIRIDLLLGMIYFRRLLRGTPVSNDDIDTAIYLVLGLNPPRSVP